MAEPPKRRRVTPFPPYAPTAAEPTRATDAEFAPRVAEAHCDDASSAAARARLAAFAAWAGERGAALLPDDDYAVFPPLAPAARASLARASAAAAARAPAPLPEPILERLRAVHGFDAFDGADGAPKFARPRVLHVDPLVLAFDDFFSADECERHVARARFFLPWSPRACAA